MNNDGDDLTAATANCSWPLTTRHRRRPLVSSQSFSGGLFFITPSSVEASTLRFLLPFTRWWADDGGAVQWWRSRTGWLENNHLTRGEWTKSLSIYGHQDDDLTYPAC